MFHFGLSDFTKIVETTGFVDETKLIKQIFKEYLVLITALVGLANLQIWT